jgi:hypothetical protein
MRSARRMVSTRMSGPWTGRLVPRRALVLGLSGGLIAAIVVTVVSGGAGASPAWPSVIQAAQTVGPVNPQLTQGQFIDCPSPTECVELGMSGGNSDGLLPWIGTLSDGSWNFANGPVPGDASGTNASAQISGLSCSSASFCLATGTYVDDNNVQQGLLLTMADGSWTATTAPVPAGAADGTGMNTSLNGVSCWADGGCVAVGTYKSATESTATMAVELTDSIWSATAIAPPTNVSTTAPDLNMTQVACDPSGTCVAAGVYTPMYSSFSSPQLATNAGGSWSSTEAPGFSESVSSIACPTTGDCTAVGDDVDANGFQQALVLQQSGSEWTATTVPVPGESAPLKGPNSFVFVNALSCPAPGSCVADGTFQTAANEKLGMILEQTASGWTAQQAPLPSDWEQGSGFVELGAGSLSCPAVGDCTAVGSYQTQASGNTKIGQAGMVLTQSDGSWVVASQQAWPSGYVPGAPDSIVYSQLYGVSCATAETCWSYGWVKNNADVTVDEQGDVNSIATTRPGVGTTTPVVSLAPSSATITPAEAVTFAVTVSGSTAGGSPSDPVSFYVCGPTAVPTPCTTFANPLGFSSLTPGADDTSTATSPAFSGNASGYWCAAAYYYGDSNYGAASDLTTDGCFDVTPIIVSSDTTTFTEHESPTPFQVAVGPDAAAVNFAGTGTLPPGVSLSSTGVLAGTPEAEGTFPLTITATDTTGHSATQSFVLSVSSSTSLQIVTTSPLPNAVVGGLYSVRLAASGGGKPKYKWSLVSSALPKGLKLNKKSGTISGKPKQIAVGNDSFEIQVSSGPNSTAAIFSISVT